ncbi:hypothetical protein A2Y83_04480 [Candidatus Falkowbacteria bacterium RBG_13_39_14]|uniref:Uncharacterized protein n=1 Tax=Candidatus Falkowbacteria bacterium RBG_13_39_14 TaxID=1797985 RepID=A0A1F5S497_9BACT|nr:MAG: hypothetical protein A2Y83_04480 [Candidatus Falkowbacteria bacterium RBG_13_39_14]
MALRQGNNFALGGIKMGEKILAIGFTPDAELQGLEGVTFVSKEDIAKCDPSSFDKVVYRHPNIDGVEGPDENLAALIKKLPPEMELVVYCNKPCVDFGLIAGRGCKTLMANMPATLAQALNNNK